MQYKTLTKKQKGALAKHAVHHTAKHLKAMKDDMKAGMTFLRAHKRAKRKVGK